MAKKTANQQIKAALATGGNNKLTKSEISNLTQAGIGLDKILTVAAKNSATIGGQAQSAFGIDQNKQGAISYTPGASPMAGVAPKPGSGWAITGSQTVQTTSPSSGSSRSEVPTYTYMAPAKPSPAPAPVAAPATPVAPAAAPAPATPATQGWGDSIDAGTQAMIDALNQTILDNQNSQQLYMGMIGDLMGQMAAVPQQAQQAAVPYAVTTSANAPAQGAQMTQAISRRLKNLSTSLAIAPSESAAAGTGLNIPV